MAALHSITVPFLSDQIHHSKSLCLGPVQVPVESAMLPAAFFSPHKRG